MSVESEPHLLVTHDLSLARAAGGPPLFQYRVWDDIAGAADLLRGLGAPHRVEHRRDIYLLGTRRHHNVKVRAQRLEISDLLGVVDGFEQWNRAANHRLPCATGDAQRWLHHVAGVDASIAAPEPDEKPLGRRRLLNSAVRCGLRPAVVDKHRLRFVLGELRAEATTMALADGAIELACVAFEGSDLAALVELRRYLGLELRRNMAVPIALEQALQTHES